MNSKDQKEQPVKVKKKPITSSFEYNDLNSNNEKNVNSNQNITLVDTNVTGVRGRSHTVGSTTDSNYDFGIPPVFSKTVYNSEEDLNNNLLFSRSPIIGSNLSYDNSSSNNNNNNNKNKRQTSSSSSTTPLMGGNLSFGLPTLEILSSPITKPISQPIQIKTKNIGSNNSAGKSPVSESGGSVFLGFVTGGSQGKLSSPALSPGSFKPSPSMMLGSLSPSIFSQEPLQKRLSEGYMNEFYELDKDPKALEKEADELKTWLNVVIPTQSSLARKELKFIIRRGIPDEKRVQVWKTILGFDESNENVFEYKEAMYAAYGNNSKPKKIRNIPTFGGVLSPSDHYLTESGIEQVKHILSLVALNFPEIEYCPLIPDIVHILMIFMSEPSVYKILNILIESSKNSFYRYLNTNNTYCTAFILTFDTLIENHIPKLYKYMVNNLGIGSSKPFSEEWFSRLFVSFIPFPTVLRIFDIYLNEGFKVIYRVGLALLMIHKRTLMKCSSAEKFLGTLKNLNIQMNDSDQLIKKAFGIHLKRNQLNSIDAKQNIKLHDHPEPSIPIYYKPKVLTPSKIIEDESIYEVIWNWLPHRLCICDPRIIFSTNTHGFSLSQVYEICKGHYPVMVFIKSRTNVFGFFSGEELKPKDKYWGSSETFIFSLKPNIYVYKPILLDINNSTTDTKINSLYLQVGNDSLKVGSSEFGENAIYLDHELHGKSNSTETFANPPLNDSEQFESIVLEVIAFE
ncbi:RabGAP/TBC domain-containing protein [Tieghemostelium lacteum]|uniref:RabGAP/TBC domain-containing protein n=1 Tax=Tieghemostelium lacteum TaxID=361077 RepID=A0A151ZKE5_TIELA|nr:RabGAP/TBC domain-containing protein [Tieghemostelium lacteum]|eukprot:KYQ94360.1 RabGAP/TBC domain-containing protein [Tieghemostelium lacteum]